MKKKRSPPPQPSPAPAAAAPKATPGDWARLAVAMGILVYGPQFAMMAIVDGLTPHAFTGWFLHLVFTVPMTAVVALVLWPPAWLVVRRSMTAPMAQIFAVMFTPFVAWQVVGYLDVAFDRDPGRRVEVRYLRYVRPHKGSNYDVIAHWDSPGDTVDLKGFGALEGERRPGATVSLTVHRGWLGMEWVGPSARR